MTIKHLVLPGGGINGLKTLGVLFRLSEKNVFKVSDIESIYATSISSFIAVLIALNFEWDYIIDYMIKRPWHEALHLNILGLVSNRGLFDRELFQIFFKPFFDAKGISLNITLKQLASITKMELHFFSLNLHTFEMVDLCHRTHPNLSVLTAVQMTAAVPMLISPVFYENHFYVDGALGGTNYPLNYCNKPPEEILGIYNDYAKSKIKNCQIDNSTSFFEYLVFLCHRLVDNLLVNKQNIVDHSLPKIEVTCETNQMSINEFYETIMSLSKRQELFDEGTQTAEDYLNIEKDESKYVCCELPQAV